MKRLLLLVATVIFFFAVPQANVAAAVVARFNKKGTALYGLVDNAGVGGGGRDRTA